MIYRSFGKLNYKVTQLGFGAMRFPEKEIGGKTVVDRDASIALLQEGVSRGLNFFDTHPLYCLGESEQVLGEALLGLREKVLIQTKCSLWKELEPGEYWRDSLDRSLANLRCDFIDFYIAHALRWETFQQKGKDFLDMIRRAKDEGIIGHTGFSSHDKPENVMKLLEVEEFECMTIQYNLVDRQYEKCIETAAKKGMGVTIMGPVAGGILEKLPRGKKKIKPRKILTVPEMALRFVLHNPHISCAISGMSTPRQLEENFNTAFSPDPLTKGDYHKILRSFDELKGLANLYCTRCGYCLPCPQNINISGVFYAMNLLRVYGARDQAEFFYSLFTKPDKDGMKRDPSVCVECGECEKKCPQKIRIIPQLKEALELFGKPK